MPSVKVHPAPVAPPPPPTTYDLLGLTHDEFMLITHLIGAVGRKASEAIGVTPHTGGGIYDVLYDTKIVPQDTAYWRRARQLNEVLRGA